MRAENRYRVAWRALAERLKDDDELWSLVSELDDTVMDLLEERTGSVAVQAWRSDIQADEELCDPRSSSVASPFRHESPAALVVDDSVVLARFEAELVRRDLKPATIDLKVRRIRELAEMIRPRSVLSASKDEIEDFLEKKRGRTRGDRIAGNTRRCYLSHLSDFFGWASEEKLLDEVPTKRVARPRLPRALPRPITEERLARALELADEWPRARRRQPGQLRCWLLLGALEGLRCKEIAGLCTEDVDFEHELLTVRNGKGGHERTLPLHPLVAASLPRIESGPLFYLNWGGVVKGHNVSHDLNEFLHALGISDTAHTLRHFFGTNIYRETKDLRLTQELLGHANPTTSAIYTGFDRTAAAPAVGALTIGGR